MKLRRLDQTGAFQRLASYFNQRAASMAQLLQQQLDSFSSRRLVDDPYGSSRFVMEPTGQSVGEFVVEPVPSETPGQEKAYIREGANEVMVDSTVALEYLQALSLPVTNEQVWEALSAASSDTAAQSEWDQQFTARRRR